MRARSLPPLLALLSLLVPASAALPDELGCNASSPVCAYDVATGEGTCAEDGFEAGATAVSANLPPRGDALVMADSACWRDGTWQAEHTRLSASVTSSAVGNVYVTWAEFHGSDGRGNVESFCFVELQGAGMTATHACPAALGPPSPGWGRLLP